MAKLTDLEYLKLSKGAKFWYKINAFFAAIPVAIASGLTKIGRFFKMFGINVANVCKEVFTTFKNGDYKTRLSFIILGFGSLARGQILRGLLFLFFEVVFILYMIFMGGYFLTKLFTLGNQNNVMTSSNDNSAGLETNVTLVFDDSFKILLYGVITLFFVAAFIYTWYVNIKQNRISQEILASGKPLKSSKQDLHSLIDDQFHKTLLALPVLGIVAFTVLPIIFMVLIAFTNYDKFHNGRDTLFQWVGFNNFELLFNFANSNGPSFSATFGEILLWTLIWAFFATFTNYFLGMLVAMMINKKGIKLKKLWRTVLVLTIAIPQFISLLYVGKMFAADGIINGILKSWGLIDRPLPFWTDPNWAKVTVILINIWVGIPYLMLITTGVLMNIPKDLYESAKVDGASPWKTYTKITLPYMLFVTGPYLLTSFTSNMNNFNVIYLLNGGSPTDIRLTNAAGKTDLLITWLFKLTTQSQEYYLASIIGIMVFIVVAIISLVVYNLLPSMKNEEDFQ